MMTEGAVVLKQCGYQLTKYEQHEILPYPEIYLLGLERQKIQVSSTLGNNNYGRLNTLLYACDDVLWFYIPSDHTGLSCCFASLNMFKSWITHVCLLLNKV